MNTDTSGLLVIPPLDARIPKWSMELLQPRACPFCHADNPALLVRPDRLPIAFCDHCQLWYVSALPPLHEIQALYQGYWHALKPKDLSQSYAARLVANDGFLDDDMRLSRLSALSGGSNGRRLLEIGCGCGEFLVAARCRGASVVGNDIAEEACSFVRGRLGIPVFQGELRSQAFVEQHGQMDIVAMSDLIEHPIEPLKTIETALEVLKPGGLLLILTPNGGEATGDVSGAGQWVGFRVDLEHRQYLSSATIAMLANRFHCRTEHLETLGYPGVSGIDRLPPGPSSWKNVVRAQLKRSRLLRALVRSTRPDPRLGTYHLVAILRKLPAAAL